MIDHEFEMAVNSEDFQVLINVCESSIRALERHWHFRMEHTLKGEKYNEVKMQVKDALIGLRSNMFLLEVQKITKVNS